MLTYIGGLRGLNFGLNLYLHPYFVYASIEALTCLQICAGWLESLLLENVSSTKIAAHEISGL